MLGKSQAVEDFNFCQPSQILPIYRIIARSPLSQILPIMNLAGKRTFVKHKWKQHLQEHACARADTALFSMHLCSCTRQRKFSHYEMKWKAKRYWIRESDHKVFRGEPIRLFFRCIRIRPQHNLYKGQFFYDIHKRHVNRLYTGSWSTDSR